MKNRYKVYQDGKLLEIVYADRHQSSDDEGFELLNNENKIRYYIGSMQFDRISATGRITYKIYLKQ